MLLVATVALWLRSYWRSDSVARCMVTGAAVLAPEPPTITLDMATEWRFVSGNGTVAVERTSEVLFDRRRLGYRRKSRDARNIAYECDHVPTLRSRLGFRAYTSGRSDELRQWSMPIAWLAVGFALLPFLRATSHLAARRRRGGCPTCGYDLRATPDRCPECGTVPDGKAMTTA